MRPILILAALAAFCAGSGPARAQAGFCRDLWYRRNAAYKEAGYCFRTADAIRAFGNAGCQYDDMASVPLSPGARRMVADIVEQEREAGCR